VLGPHDTPDGRVVRAFVPGALDVEVLKRADRAPLGCLDRSGVEGLFEGLVSDAEPYLLRISRPGGVQDTEDPYAFGALLGELDLHLFNEGRHFELAGHTPATPGRTAPSRSIRSPRQDNGIGFCLLIRVAWNAKHKTGNQTPVAGTLSRYLRAPVAELRVASNCVIRYVLKLKAELVAISRPG
jgi:alpha-1,4-glucan branchign enzyme GlgB-like protein